MTEDSEVMVGVADDSQLCKYYTLEKSLTRVIT